GGGGCVECCGGRGRQPARQVVGLAQLQAWVGERPGPIAEDDVTVDDQPLVIVGFGEKLPAAWLEGHGRAVGGGGAPGASPRGRPVACWWFSWPGAGCGQVHEGPRRPQLADVPE